MSTLTGADILLTRLWDRILAYVALTKPVIQFLILATAATAMVLEGSLLRTPGKMVLALALLAMSGGAAKTFNQILERHDDAVMSRTRSRPLPCGRLTLTEAWVFGCTLWITSTVMLWLYFNARCAILAAATVIFYSFIYTLYLKRRTRWNVVIGGLAGSMAPIIGWAVSGSEFTLTPFLIAIVILFWTPPHFWALALYYKEDYQHAPYPILPVTAGTTTTWRHIVAFSVLTVILSLTWGIVGQHLRYLAIAIPASCIYIVGTILARRSTSPAASYRLFLLSILYLLLFCVALIFEGLSG